MFRKTVVTLVTLFCFCFSYVFPWDAVLAAGPPQTAVKRSRPAKPASRLVDDLRQAERHLQRLEALASAAQDQVAGTSDAKKGGPPWRIPAEDLAALRALREAISARGDEVLAGLATVGTRLAAGALPEVARSRHRALTEGLESGLGAARSALAAVEDAPPDQAWERLGEALDALRSALGPEFHNPLDPDRLPFRPADPVQRAPRTASAEFLTPEGGLAGAKLLTKATLPTPADLAETVDVRLSDGVRELADSLANDPLTIFNWVRQNVTFVPTFGSIQGSEGCRLSRECNAHDTASLLIALLRASNVPARYVVGTVEVTPDFFRRAVGDFEDLAAATRFAASGGIPTTRVNGGGGQPVAVRLEHAWVEAFVGYAPSRGAAPGAADTWVPLDAALKPLRFQPPVDLGAALGVDSDALLDDVLATGTLGADGDSITGVSLDTIESIRRGLNDDALAFLDANLPAGATVGEVIGALDVAAQPLAVLPGAVSGRVLVVGGRVSELPAASRHRVTLQLLDRFGISEFLRLERSTAEIADQRVTLAYIPSTQTDQDILDEFGGLLETPPHLIELLPVLNVEGQPVAVGSPVTPGTIQIVRVRFDEPGSGGDSVEHQITAGTYAALGLDLQRVTPEEISDRQARLDAANDLVSVEDVNADDILGELLHIHAKTYFAQVGTSSRLVSHQLNVAALKRPAEMLATMAPSFAFLFGAPVDVTNFGMSVDVRRFTVSVASRTDDRDRERAYVFTSGNFSSAAEHSIFETLQQGQAVSAVKLLGEAQRRGIPVFAVDATNVGRILPQLTVSSAVIADVRNAVAAGKTALVPRDNVPLLDYNGVGYIILDRETGAAAYLISGGLAGGGTAEDTDLLDVIKDVLSKLNTLRGIAELISKLKPLRFAAKLPVIGLFLSVVDAVLTGIDIAQRTGNIWTGIGVGAAVFLLNLGISALMTLAGIGALAGGGIFGLIAAIAISLVVGAIVSAIQTAILDALFPPFASRFRRRKTRRAAAADAEEPEPDLGIGFTPASEVV